MASSFDQLRDAVPPPSWPIEPGSIEGFPSVEAQLGLALPRDYKRLICAYGTGSWKEFLWILNPFSSNPNLIYVWLRAPRSAGGAPARRRFQAGEPPALRRKLLQPLHPKPLAIIPKPLPIPPPLLERRQDRP